MSERALAQSAVEHARQKLRLQSIGRWALPEVVAVRVVDIAFDAPGLTGTAVAYGAVVVAPLLALWVLDLVGYRRSTSSEGANWRLIEGGGAR